MPELPPDNPGSPRVDAPSSAPEPPSRNLSEILDELASLTNAQQGEASAIREAVSELSRALVGLFEMIRSDRSEQSSRIAELEAELAEARAQLLKLDPGALDAAVVAVDPSDFDQLRAAAERLRASTQQLVEQAGTPAEQAAQAIGRHELDLDVESDLLMGGEFEVEAAAETDAGPGLRGEPYGVPGVLRVFPGALMGPPPDLDIDVESDLNFDAEEPLRMAAYGDSGRDFSRPSEASPRGISALHAVPEPIEIAPREARRRRMSLRRRRIDARKLEGVDPSASLRAMVGAIPDIWTAGCKVDLIIALTDGNSLRVCGGDLEPLKVETVEPGTSAHATVTATSAQLVPLFGRLALTADQSPPMIHGQRRQADLIVGWIDRAQRLPAQPL